MSSSGDYNSLDYNPEPGRVFAHVIEENGKKSLYMFSLGVDPEYDRVVCRIWNERGELIFSSAGKSPSKLRSSVSPEIMKMVLPTITSERTRSILDRSLKYCFSCMKGNRELQWTEFPEDMGERLVSKMRQYVWLPHEIDYKIIASYIVLTWLAPLFGSVPPLILVGKRKTGKTTLLLLLKNLVWNPVFISRIPNILVHTIGAINHPSFLVDELQTYRNAFLFQRKEGILNPRIATIGQIPPPDFESIVYVMSPSTDKLSGYAEKRIILKEGGDHEFDEIADSLFTISISREFHDRVLRVYNEMRSMGPYHNPLDIWAPILAVAKVLFGVQRM